MTELRRALPFLAACLLLLAAGCSLLPSPSETDRLAAELRAAEARWAAQDISSYRFTMSYRCFCPWTDPLTITVKDDQVVSVTMNGKDVPDAGRMGVPLLVESAFTQVRNGLGGAYLEAAYDPELGYPVSVTSNWSDEIVDEEWAFEITELEVLP